MKSMTPIRDLTAAARDGLAGNWGKSIGVTLVYFALSAGISYIPYIGWLLQLVFSAPLMVGITIYMLAMLRRQDNPFGLLFAGFNRFGAAVCTYLLVMLIVLAWMLPFVVLFVLSVVRIDLPGSNLLLLLTCLIFVAVVIPLQMRYSLALYVVADDPSAGARQAVRRGVELMKGNYWRLGLLWLRFTGWMLLGILTLGIGFIWLGPYYMAAITAFYDDLTGNS